MIQIDFPMPLSCVACPLHRFSAAAGRMVCPLIIGDTSVFHRPYDCPLKEGPDHAETPR